VHANGKQQSVKFDIGHFGTSVVNTLLTKNFDSINQDIQQLHQV
jgi:hypothetical protein